MSNQFLSDKAIEARKKLASQLEMFSVTGLSPCPFCRGTDLSLVTVLTEEGRKPIVLQCDICGATGPFGETEEQLRAFWNIRA